MCVRKFITYQHTELAIIIIIIIMIIIIIIIIIITISDSCLSVNNLKWSIFSSFFVLSCIVMLLLIL
jgi:hypothetical protein